MTTWLGLGLELPGWGEGEGRACLGLGLGSGSGFVRHVLAELARHPLEVTEGDLACLVVVEELEDPPDTARAGGDRASKGGAKPMLQGQG